MQSGDPRIREKFPDLEPLEEPPALITILGCGMKLMGQRDVDEETSSFVSNQCLVILAIPILCLKAVRVAAAPVEGWYFLGRASLSGAAKLWNMLVLLGVPAFFIGMMLNIRSESPEYLARQAVAEVDELLEEGDWRAAADSLQDVAAKHPSQRQLAMDRFRKLATQVVAGLNSKDGYVLIEYCISMNRLSRSNDLSSQVLYELVPQIMRSNPEMTAQQRLELLSIVEHFVDSAKNLIKT